MSRIYICDEEGYHWFFEDHRIRMLEAELENPDEADENGYPCSSLESGIELLNKWGYILSPAEDEE